MLPERNASDDRHNRIAELNERSWETAQSNPTGALRLAEEACTLANEADDLSGAATGALNKGWARIHLGRFEEAVADLHTAREQFTAASDTDGVMKAMNALGVLSFRIGETDQARELWEEVLELARSEASLSRQIASLNNLGELFGSLGDYRAALAHYERAGRLAGETGDESVRAVIQANLGRIHLEEHDLVSAEKHLNDALELAAAAHDRITEAEVLTQLGRTLTLRLNGADPDGEAEQLHLQSAELCEEMGYPTGVILALEHLGRLLITEHRLDEAEQHLRRAAEMAQGTDARVTTIDALKELVDSYRTAGQTESALRVATWLLEVEREHAGADLAREVQSIRAMHELDQARMEAEIVRLRNVELREKSEELELSNRKLQLMHRIGSELTSTLDLDEMARRLHDRLNELMTADVFGVAFFDEEHELLDFAVVIEDNQRLTPFQIPVASTESFSSWVVRNRREIVLQDADRSYKDYLTKRVSISSTRCRSLVFLPLELEGRIIGVLTVQSHEKHMYDDDRIEMLHLLSPYIAVAMDNSRKLYTIRALNRALEKEKEQLQDAYGRIAHLANHDILTQLPNRRLLAELINEYIPLARRQSARFAVLYVDLDDFKPVNDTYGHDAGDAVLVSIAKRLNQAVRESDTVARIGGDEFLIVLRNFAQAPQLMSTVEGIARKVLHSISLPVRVAGDERRLSASIGICVFPDDGASYNELIVASDRAMYRAKEAGKSRIATQSQLLDTTSGGASDRREGDSGGDHGSSRESSRDESILSPSKRNQPST